jgi:hypothetical protein
MWFSFFIIKKLADLVGQTALSAHQVLTEGALVLVVFLIWA